MNDKQDWQSQVNQIIGFEFPGIQAEDHNKK
jgi:hypothetical protein